MANHTFTSLMFRNIQTVHTEIHTYMHACIHTYMHAYIHTYIHAYIHTYSIHTFILWYMHICIYCVYRKGSAGRLFVIYFYGLIYDFV